MQSRRQELVMKSLRFTGFSLIEVLVATVVLSIGVLGVTALQTTSYVMTESSVHRAQASALAVEIVERMRVNTSEAKAGNYNISALPTLTSDCSHNTSDCNTDQMKDHDLRVWSARVAALLPGGTATISSTVDSGTVPVDITVTMQWDDSRGRDAAVTQAFVFQLEGLNKCTGEC